MAVYATVNNDTTWFVAPDYFMTTTYPCSVKCYNRCKPLELVRGRNNKACSQSPIPSDPRYIAQRKTQKLHQHQAQMQRQRQQAEQQQQQGERDPATLAVADFLLSQDLKQRNVILGDRRMGMFRVKCAIRVLRSPAYEKARSKNKLLPEVKDHPSAENAFKHMTHSLLAVCVSQVEPSDGHAHAKSKRTEGLWTVRIKQQQEVNDDDYYVWLYAGSQWKPTLYAFISCVLAVLWAIAINIDTPPWFGRLLLDPRFLVPLWKKAIKLNTPAYYGAVLLDVLMSIALAFCAAAMIIQAPLYYVTTFIAPPGIWLYPRLFEDVPWYELHRFQGFRPVWAWQETPEDILQEELAKEEEKAGKAAAKIFHTNYQHEKPNTFAQSPMLESQAAVGHAD